MKNSKKAFSRRHLFLWPIESAIHSLHLNFDPGVRNIQASRLADWQFRTELLGGWTYLGWSGCANRD